ncbi:hypothetical protein [Listeria monocytogenes]|uniref:hypothetical protein n=1 Tax=Listeria monocytogenes TaxID=1639 RepID=UPI0011EA8602|nr:hypothetical protein [Listeria monocytogenes]TYV60606.1 hypothetical protein FZ059_12385 [Listeria monocytogenes]
MGTDAKLPNPTPSTKYTGEWQNVGNGTVDKPKGSFTGTATMIYTKQVDYQEKEVREILFQGFYGFISILKEKEND